MSEQLSGKTIDAVGDGMTTASVLAREIIKLGLLSVTPVVGSDDIEAFATIAVGNDGYIGSVVDKVGPDGV